MTEANIFALVVGLVAVALGVYNTLKAGQTPTVTGSLEEFEEVISDIEIAAGAAKEYVAAAEQLWRSGRLDKDGRLGWVLGKLQALFPDIPEETLVDSIEAGVTWLKALSGELVAKAS